MLSQVAQRLKDSVRANDTVARLGGDEFVVLLPDAGNDAAAAMEQARRVGEKIRQSLCLPYQLGQLVHHSSTSIGAVAIDDPALSAEAYLKLADKAMYRAKAAGGNALVFDRRP